VACPLFPSSFTAKSLTPNTELINAVTDYADPAGVRIVFSNLQILGTGAGIQLEFSAPGFLPAVTWVEVALALYWQQPPSRAQSSASTLDALTNVEGASIVSFDSSALIFGGRGAAGLDSRTRMIDAATPGARVLNTTGSPPSARWKHTACRSGGSLWVLGGIGSDGNNMGGLFELHVEERHWINWSHTLMQSTAPSVSTLGRQLHLACTAQHLIVIATLLDTSELDSASSGFNTSSLECTHTRCNNTCAHQCVVRYGQFHASFELCLSNCSIYTPAVFVFSSESYVINTLFRNCTDAYCNSTCTDTCIQEAGNDPANSAHCLLKCANGTWKTLNLTEQERELGWQGDENLSHLLLDVRAAAGDGVANRVVILTRNNSVIFLDAALGQWHSLGPVAGLERWGPSQASSLAVSMFGSRLIAVENDVSDASRRPQIFLMDLRQDLSCYSDCMTRIAPSWMPLEKLLEAPTLDPSASVAIAPLSSSFIILLVGDSKPQGSQMSTDAVHIFSRQKSQQLRFELESSPVEVTIGQALIEPLRLAVLDANGILVHRDRDQIRVRITALNESTGALIGLTGTTTVESKNGHAVFEQLTISSGAVAGSLMVFEARMIGPFVLQAISRACTVVAGPASQMIFLESDLIYHMPPEPFREQPTVEIVDDYGNVLQDDWTSISVRVQELQLAVWTDLLLALGGNITRQAVAGKVTWTDLSLNHEAFNGTLPLRIVFTSFGLPTGMRALSGM